MEWTVYILLCCDSSLYTGSTNNLEKRLYEHNNLKCWAHYTKIRRPVELVYFEKYKTIWEVRKRENEIKKLDRAMKQKLISSLIIN